MTRPASPPPRTYPQVSGNSLKVCTHKKCEMAGLPQFAKNFSKQCQSRDGRSSHCKTCKQTYASANKERIKDGYWRRKYGISSSDRLRMIAQQGNLCAICKRNLDTIKRVCTDHCHKTHRVRGILCNLCNVGVGHFLDSPFLLRRAAEYLERSKVDQPTIGGEKQ